MFKESVEALKRENLFRSFRYIESAQGPRIILDGRRVINMCSNNYLGLADHPLLKEAAKKIIDEYGVGCGASRLVGGNNILYRELEGRLAIFKETEAALVFNSGYTANIGILQGISEKIDVIFSDRLNHASIVDGIILSRVNFKRYPHKDFKALEDMLSKEDRAKKKLIVTDTIFSMDGDIAPLPDIVELAERFNAMVMVDEAHATGVLGKDGKGALNHFGLKGRVEIQMGTFSKAFGGFGAFVCGSNELIEFLINTARSLIYTTALPPSVLASNIAALNIVESEPTIRQRLWENVEYFKKGLLSYRFDISESETPIIPIILKDNELTMNFSRMLLEEGVYIQGIRPPTVPQGSSRLRVTVIATHTREDLDKALEAIVKVAKKLGVE
jgi:glycine C-acetyltransferase